MIRFLLRDSYLLYQLLLSVFLGISLYGCATIPGNPAGTNEKINPASIESVERSKPFQVEISITDLKQVTGQTEITKPSNCDELNALLLNSEGDKRFNIYRHVLPIDSRGKTNQINLSIKGVDGQNCLAPFPAEYQSQDGWIKGIIKGIEEFTAKTVKEGKTPVVYVFIHGGLNGYGSSERRISRDLIPILEGEYERDGKQIKYYPVFLVWNSSLGSTYFDSILNYDQGQWDKPEWIPFTSPFRLLGRDIPDIAMHSFLNYSKATTRWFQRLSNQDYSCQGLGVKFEKDSYFGKEFVCHGEQKYHSEFDAEDGLYYGMLPFRLISVPAVETFGKVAWKNMMARARFGMRRPCVDVYEADNAACDNGAFYELFKELKGKLDPTESVADEESAALGGKLRKLEITLVGHSMGTFVASDLVSSFPDLPYNDVVFMGAAVSIREFLDSVQRVMSHRQNHQHEADLVLENLQIDSFLNELNTACPDQDEARKIADSAKKLTQRQLGIDKRQLQSMRNLPSQTETCNRILQRANEKFGLISEVIKHLQPKKLFHFFNLSLDEHAEADEYDFETSLGMAPRGSLLEWIDDMYETPSDFLERTMGKWKNVVAARKFFDPALKGKKGNNTGYLHFEKFDLSCFSPIRHGELADSDNDRRRNCKVPMYWDPDYWRWEAQTERLDRRSD